MLIICFKDVTFMLEIYKYSICSVNKPARIYYNPHWEDSDYNKGCASTHPSQCGNARKHDSLLTWLQ